MLPSLLYWDKNRKYPSCADNKNELCTDLGLDAILNAMSGGSSVVKDAARGLLFESPAISKDNILYRQQIIKDALNNASRFLELYDTLNSDLAGYENTRQKSQPGFSRFTPVTEQIHSTAELMKLLFTLADKVRKHFECMDTSILSTGLRNYARTFRSFYSDDFIGAALRESAAIGRVSEGSSITLGAKLGLGLKGTAYVIRAVNEPQKTKPTPKHQAIVHLDSIASQLKAIELKDSALLRILSAANTVTAQTAEDLKFLIVELSFYVGCIRLHEKMASIGLPVCFPSPCTDMPDTLSFNGLVDISLALSHSIVPVANSLDLNGIQLTIVTGANQGGKSTFLRGVGCAQIMAQCGMFVAAKDFRFSLCPRVFTHFCKPEDASMDSGKLDEELARLNRIVDRLEPGAMLLMNESFSSTAECEGAAIANEVTGALYDLGVRVIFVTHLYEYARFKESEGQPDVCLLRAERYEDGTRSFVIQPGLSLPTSYGMDLFNELITFIL